MRTSMYRAGCILASFLLVLAAAAVVTELESYHICARVGHYNVVDKEMSVRREGSSVRKIDLTKIKVYTTKENDLLLVGDGVLEVIKGETVNSLEAGGLTFEFKCGDWLIVK